MNSLEPYWTAESVSAAAAACSVIVAVGIFAYDRISSWSRRAADARRLTALIAGDIGLWMPKLRTQASFFNGAAVETDSESAVEYLIANNEFDSEIEYLISEFNTERIARIIETSGVFSPQASQTLSTLLFLREATARSAQTVTASPSPADRGSIVFHLALQMNMLQRTMIQLFNSHAASLGSQRLEQECLLTGTSMHS